jgi:hypothetical protein
MNIDLHPDLTAEAYFLSLFALDSGLADHFFLECEGTEQRGRAREVLGEAIRHSVVDNQFVELRGMQVSRNGLYDLLPESLFFPLTIGTTSTNHYEVVQAIRENREKEKANRLFFAPWDTEFFLWRVQLLRQTLGLDQLRTTLYEQAVETLMGTVPPLFAGKMPLLFHFFTHAERARDNAVLLSDLLGKLLECEVRIGEVEEPEHLSHGASLGACRLGIDSVSSGSIYPDAGDWQVDVTFDRAEEMERAAIDPAYAEAIQHLLSFFVLADRNIRIRFLARPAARAITMGAGRLGINTYSTLAEIA